MSNELATNSGALATAQSSKAVQEIQAALTIAAAHPRNIDTALERIMKACDRHSLAEQAIYTYPKGKTTVTGPSIRLAEVLAQNWGNLSVGIRELSQNNDVSEVEAFAWDLETNFQETKIFHVPHIRHTKTGEYKVTDPREIYELIANNGARRLRACIMAVIPGDIMDAAVERCHKTLAYGQDPIEARLKKLLASFSEFNISEEDIEKRLGHNLGSIAENEIVILRGIYKSLKDGMAKREDFFDNAMTDAELAVKNAHNKLKATLIEKEITASEQIDKGLAGTKSTMPSSAEYHAKLVSELYRYIKELNINVETQNLWLAKASVATLEDLSKDQLIKLNNKLYADLEALKNV